ncbi:spermidine synthase [Rhizobiaceae bacterium]|nr:spermidine synthase [Rhizobiaceae bacterium]
MVPWETLDEATVPDGGRLKLMRRGDEWSIRLVEPRGPATELMNSRLSGSEEAMATVAAKRLAGIAAPRMLIGGYGMGFTLRAALGAFPTGAHITVAEIAPAVVEWARGPMADLTNAALADPRTDVEIGDVGPIIRRGGWDAILLDVDNGPDGLSRQGNDALYSDTGLAHAAKALRPGGMLIVWSFTPHATFAKRLARSGLAVEEMLAPSKGQGRKGTRHTLWVATKRG